MSQDPKNSPLLSIDPQFKPKVGVFFNKDAKMIQMQRRNQQLRQQLAAELKIFDELVAKRQQNRDKMAGVESENKLLQIESMMCVQSIGKMEDKIKKSAPEKQQKERRVVEVALEVSKLNETLELMLQQDHQSKNLIKRYRDEVKMEKTMAKSEKNLNNVCQSLKKNQQNYQKNVDILKNKLQSKKKYLGILLKKQQKSQQTVHPVQQNGSAKKEYKSYHPSTSTKSLKMAHQDQTQNDEKQKDPAKRALKDLNELIRKKNAILAKKQ